MNHEESTARQAKVDIGTITKTIRDEIDRITSGTVGELIARILSIIGTEMIRNPPMIYED